MEMQCVRVSQIGSFNITKADLPRLSEDELLIKVQVAGLCRTDLKLIRVGHRDLVLPRIPGEEVVGVVQEKGAKVKGIEEGDCVYVYPGIWCGQCRSCLKGAENLCEDMKIMGFHRDGGFSEYVTVAAKSVIAVPEGLKPEEAVFAEPLSCCLNALELSGIREGEAVGIWGAGPAGTLLHRASKALGAEPVSIEPDPVRRTLINGYESCPDSSFDVCIVAVGSKEAYVEAIGKLAPRGRLVVFSGLTPAEANLPVNFNQLHYLEQTVVGAYGCSYRHGLEALKHIASGSVPVKDMISHRMSLWDLERALLLVENRKCMKIHLYP